MSGPASDLKTWLRDKIGRFAYGHHGSCAAQIHRRRMRNDPRRSRFVGRARTFRANPSPCRTSLGGFAAVRRCVTDLPTILAQFSSSSGSIRARTICRTGSMRRRWIAFSHVLRRRRHQPNRQRRPRCPSRRPWSTARLPDTSPDLRPQPPAPVYGPPPGPSPSPQPPAPVYGPPPGRQSSAERDAAEHTQNPNYDGDPQKLARWRPHQDSPPSIAVWEITFVATWAAAIAARARAACGRTN